MSHTCANCQRVYSNRHHNRPLCFQLGQADQATSSVCLCARICMWHRARDYPTKARRCLAGVGKSLLSTDPPALRPRTDHRHVCRNPPVCARGWSPARWSKQIKHDDFGPFCSKTLSCFTNSCPST